MEDFIYDFSYIFILFLIGSIFGWFFECVNCSIRERKLIYNRGFLIGPYCPIYGWGVLYSYFFLNQYKTDPLILFVMGAIGTSILEYLVSYFMEKIYQARWWDYSKEPFNINGRICLRNSVTFGLCGLLFIYIVQPILLAFIDLIATDVLIVLSSILFIIFLIDNIVTYTIMYKIKNKIIKLDIYNDSTYEIDLEIKKILSLYAYNAKRILESFPNIKVNVPNGDKIIKNIKSGFKEIRHKHK